MKKITFLILVSLGFSLSFFSCIETINNFDKLPNGMWRASLVIENQSFATKEEDEEVLLGVDALNESELPFNFEVFYDEKGEMQVTLYNGEERIPVSEIKYGRNNSIAKDSFRFVFPEYDSYLKGNYEDNAIQGEFVITSKNNYSIPFKATYGKDFRFTPLKKKPLADLSGKWECTFEEGTKNEYKALGEFVQKGNHLTGTFRTETGDYRYLEGTVQGNKSYLSVFDGTHAFLFAMKIVDSDNLVGSFRSGKHYKAAWTGKRNPNYELVDPAKLTFIDKPEEKFNFEFPDSDGKMISLKDERFENKIKVISIMGTWCPNCKDEMQFLKTIQSKYDKDVEVLAVAFERYKDQAKAFEMIKRYKKKLDLNFDMVHGGLASKPLASEKFPMLNKIISFPTILILDQNNEAQYIHTGFNGPATSEFEPFKKEFHAKIQQLVTE